MIEEGRRKREILLWAVLVVVVCAAYSNTFATPFLFDDTDSIQENTKIQLRALTWEGLRKAAHGTRPVANLSIALTYYFHEYRVAGYHAGNLLIHLVSGFLLYLLVKATLRVRPGETGDTAGEWVPFCAASVWLLHPVQIQSVTYIIQRMTSMASLFYLLSMLLYVRARRAGNVRAKWALFAGCAASGLLSLGTKEIAATLPFFIFLYEWFFFQDLSADWLKRRGLLAAGVVVLLAAVALAYLGTSPLERIMRGYERYDFTPMERVLTQFRVVVIYLGLLAFPHPGRLNIDHHVVVSRSLVDPASTLLSLGLIAGLVVAGVLLAKRQRLLSFCVLWFFGNLVIESSFIPLELIYEHRTYLPSMLAVVAAAGLVLRCVRPRAAAIAGLCAAALVCAVWTYQRNLAWSDEVTLWRDSVEKSPDMARPNGNLGSALARSGRHTEAMKYIRRALEIEPNLPSANNNMGVSLVVHGKDEEAIAYYRKALERKPDFAVAHSNLGVALASKGETEEAVEHLRTALRLKPDSAEVYNNLALALDLQGKPEEAEECFSAAALLKPDYMKVHANRGVMLDKQGKTAEAVTHFEKALAIEPDQTEVRLRLGVALNKLGRAREALPHFERVLQDDPGNPWARNAMGTALTKMGKLDEAAEEFRKVLRADPRHTEALDNLGVVLTSRGDLDEAVERFREALHVDPDFAEAHDNLGVALDLQGKKDEAMACFRKALEADPGYAEAHYHTGVVLMSLRRPEEAMKQFREALRLNPRNVSAHNNLGVGLASRGRYEEAVSHFSEALRIDPDDVNARENLRRARERMKKAAEAAGRP